MGSSFARVAIFALAIVTGYAVFSNLYVPRSSLDSVRDLKEDSLTAESMDLSDLSGVELAALGEEIYKGKGSCALCHDGIGGRAPALDSIATTALLRLKDARYKGKASDPVGYMRESMEDPSIYVVKGFGVAGTGDSISPMPGVLGGQIELTEAEVSAVIAYLQQRSGADVTVTAAKQPGASLRDEVPDKAGTGR